MLKGFERTYLRGLAHALKPVAQIGKGGLTSAVEQEVDKALGAHELIKVRFHQHKEERLALARKLAEATRSDLVGTIGNVAVLFRPQDDAEKRRIQLPVRSTASPAR